MKKVKFNAVHPVYNAFRVGGNLWQMTSFELEGEAISLDKRISGVLFYDEEYSKLYRVYHKQSGGMLGDGVTRKDAIKMANHNIEITPDIRQQMKDLISKPKASGEKDKVLQLLAKNK